MIIQEQWDLIKKSVDMGYAKHQRVHYNTNGTVFRTEYLKWLKEFVWVDIQFSIDGIEVTKFIGLFSKEALVIAISLALYDTPSSCL